MSRRSNNSITHKDWLDRTYGTRPKLPESPPVQLVLPGLERFASFLRRVYPSTIAPDIIPIQPMTGPVGTIFTVQPRFKHENNLPN